MFKWLFGEHQSYQDLIEEDAPSPDLDLQGLIKYLDANPLRQNGNRAIRFALKRIAEKLK